MDSYFNTLNESQKKAVLHNEGPLLVLAGAGSGKTRVLTVRIARLVKEKICKPEEILAVTFTNKAAAEMRERISSLTSKKLASLMTICTFHSLGVKILREDGEAIGLQKHFTIIDENDKITTIKTIMRTLGIRGIKDEDPVELAQRISFLKNDFVEPVKLKEDPEQRKIGKIYEAYNIVLHKRNMVDFDDLLLLPLQLFLNHPDILKKYQKRFKYISIDEFQDTNNVQMKLATLLAQPENNIMVVGDDDQGIYSWRGANIHNIISFPSLFKDCKTIILDKNYRSTRQILEAANAVISNNRVRKHKKIKAVVGDGDLIMHYKGDDEVDEALWIAETIKNNQKEGLFDFGDNAILLRTNAMMRRFEEELRVRRIPYRVAGSISFFERKEVKDVLSYLRFFSNPLDEISLMRVLKVPDKGITPSTLNLLDELATGKKISLWEAMQDHKHLGDKIAPIQHEKIEAFLEFYRKFKEKFDTGKLSETIREVLNETGYFAHLQRYSKDDEDPERRKENVEEIIHGIEIFENRKKDINITLDQYLQELSLIIGDDEDNVDDSFSKNRVTLMTFHKSKGLEFPVVFLAGLDKDYIPSPRAVEEGNIEEERRLFYVGMTRAQKRLYLTYPGTKLFRGKPKIVTPCPFINEIPEEFLDGKIGEKDDTERMLYIENFFKEMKLKFGGEDTQN